jgi:hypothetical protein
MHKGARYVIDIECDSLTPKVIHVVVLKNIDTNTYLEYTKDNAHLLSRVLDDASLVIGHNIIDFDLPVLSNLWSIAVHQAKVVDTLILSRLLRYDIDGGHSLHEWGTRLGHPKLEFSAFDTYTPEMLVYCRNDADLTEKLYRFLIARLQPMGTKPIEVEHKIAFICPVAEETTRAEGMIKLRDMSGDLYDYNPKNLSLSGKQTGRILRVGDKIKIRVKSVDIEKELLDYEMLE